MELILYIVGWYLIAFISLIIFTIIEEDLILGDLIVIAFASIFGPMVLLFILWIFISQYKDKVIIKKIGKK